MADIDTFQIAKLDLAPGDILVVRSTHPITQAACERVLELVSKVVGNEQRVLILGHDIDLAVLTRPALEAMG